MNRSSDEKRVTRAERQAAVRYWAIAACIVVLASFIRSDALQLGFSVDDYAQLAMMKHAYPVPRAPLGLFTFSSGDAAENRAFQSTGFFPWWSHPALRIAFFRPLASALMWLDVSLFGLDAFAYHVHGFLWWLAMLFALALLLRRVLPEPAALVALLLFSVHEVHAMLLGWIALRNAIVAGTFALLGLYFQLRARELGRRRERVVALASFALALLAGEYAVAFLAYAVLFELTCEDALRARLVRATPWLALLVVYLGVRAALGFGSFASGMYVDPIAEPAKYLHAASHRLPALAGDLVLAIASNWWSAGFPWAAQLAEHGLVPAAWAHDILPLRVVQERIGLFALLLGAFLLGWAARAPEARRARFLVLGTPLALVPALSSLPESRLLGPALVGWTVALASLAQHAAARAGAQPRARGVATFAVAAAFALYQACMPIWYGSFETDIGLRMARGARASILAPQLDRMLANARHVLLLGAADPTTTIYVPLVRRVHGRPAPRSCQLLTGTFAPHRLERLSSTSFALERLQRGYDGGDAYASTFNSDPLRRGDHVEIGGLRVVVERTFADEHCARATSSMSRSTTRRSCCSHRLRSDCSGSRSLRSGRACSRRRRFRRS